MQIEEAISDQPQTCWRCTTLGLPPNGITAGENFILITDSERQILDASCMDCYTRLVEAVNEQEAGEEWKSNL